MKKTILIIMGILAVSFLTACSDKFYEMRKSPCADYCLLENTNNNHRIG